MFYGGFMKKELKCPKDDALLISKRIEYGLPSPEMGKDNSIILGGYECPSCKKVFIIKDGKLAVLEEGEEIEEIDDDIQDLEMLDFLEEGL